MLSRCMTEFSFNLTILETVVLHFSLISFRAAPCPDDLQPEH